MPKDRPHDTVPTHIQPKPPQDLTAATVPPNTNVTPPDPGATVPSTAPRAPGLPAVPGYTVTREVARGGMGFVYAAHDPVFGREVAVKVMHAGQDVNRFVVEARVTAQLPHPGIPPVHAMGMLADGRPFLAMKLIAGRTLADELQTAKPADLPRVLSAFERICETVGFAHARGIVHRDLKPSNVMVGRFGEVLVMDWGLAKQVGGGQRSATIEEVSRLAILQRGMAETVAGSVKGTPSYMAPEQARGEPVDARADVFALGGILATLLTGNPPFVGQNVMDTVLKAACADIGECFEELDECGADPELIAVAKKCLAARPDDRYADAGQVTAVVAAYRIAVEERLRAAERNRAAAEARAEEEENTRHEAEARADEQRKRRRTQLGLAAALFVIVCGAGAFGWWYDHQKGERKLAAERAAMERAQFAAEQDRKADQARQGVVSNRRLAAELREQYKFKAAEALLAQAAELARDGPPGLLAEVEEAQRDLAFVVELDGIRFRKWVWVPEEGGKGRFDKKACVPEYQAAFAARGLDPTTRPPTDVAKRIAAFDVRADLVKALEDWALFESDDAVKDRLLETARRAEPGPWTDRLRTLTVWRNLKALQELDKKPDLDAPPASIHLLAQLMKNRDLDPSNLLHRARARRPNDFELAFALGQWYSGLTSPGGRQIGPYEAARAIRPDNVAVLINLGNGLRQVENYAAAEPIYEAAVRIDPRQPYAHYNLGRTRKDLGKLDGAIEAYEAATRVDPKYALPFNALGAALDKRNKPGDADRAMEAYRRATEADPTFAKPHYNLGLSLERKKDEVGAIEAYKSAVRIDPNYAEALANLGAIELRNKRYETALEYGRRAIKANPTLDNAHWLIGVALWDSGKRAEALEPLREAVRLNPARWQKEFDKLTAEK